MKKYLLYFSILSVLILSGCTDSNEEQIGTGEIVSGAFDSLIQDYSEITPVPEAASGTIGNTGNTENTTTESNETPSGNEAAGSGEVVREPVRQSWFGVEECDRIINFDLCVISKAPIENQDAMKESLQKALEPWKLLANAQLREVCQKALETDTFKEVKSHYEALENGCIY